MKVAVEGGAKERKRKRERERKREIIQSEEETGGH